MLSYALRSELNRSNDWIANKNKVGDLIHKGFNVVKGNWKYSRDGGAAGDFSMKDQDGSTAVKIPSGAIVLGAFAYVKTALGSGGLATVDLQIEGANDLLAAEAVASFTGGAKIQGIPDFGTLADSVVLTAERTLTMSVNVAALNAGELEVYVFYVF